MARSEAAAFAPAAITNFFQIHRDSTGAPAGATGGGYVLSKGTTTRATLVRGTGRKISTVVNGDPGYNARTTRRAVSLLVDGLGPDFGELILDQDVETPIGSGFGSSAASAVSAVYAAAGALGSHMPRTDLALFAHRAEIIERTGLGTVSVTYEGTGAGAIVKSGVPGEARFVNVEVPKDTRIVTAFVAPYDKKDALNSKDITERIDRFGGEALAAFERDPTLENLGKCGERFSRELGLETPEVKKLEALALSAGAMFASQNMIGFAVHCLTDADTAGKVGSALGGLGPQVRVDQFEVGTKAAGLTS